MSEKMTATQAVTFEHTSSVNAMIARAGKACNCQPYVDIFTFRRWNAQGYRIIKGQHGTKLTTWINVTKVDKESGEKVPAGTLPKTAHVFCRCQVKPSERKTK